MSLSRRRPARAERRRCGSLLHGEPGGVEELALLGRDHDLFELQALAEDRGVSAAFVPGLPHGDESLSLIFTDYLVAGEVAARCAAVGEALRSVLLGGQADADGFGGVGDRGQAEQRAEGR